MPGQLLEFKPVSTARTMRNRNLELSPESIHQLHGTSTKMDSSDSTYKVEAIATPKTKQAISYDPEFGNAVKDNEFTGLRVPQMTTGQELRAFGNPIMEAVILKECFAFPTPEEPVTETTVEVESFDGVKISVSRFAQQKHRNPLKEGEALRPAIYHVHGGGMVAGSVQIYAPQSRRNAAMWDTQVFAVDYRVAPENAAPGPVEDAFAGLQWLSQNAKSMGIDPARIVIYGDSAGGGIAAGTALLARDRKLEPPLAKQVLIYPMLDDRTRYGANWPIRGLLSWTEADNAIGWASYLGTERAGKEEADVSIHAAPGRATIEDLVGLPKTYIDTGGLDLFCEEDVGYAAKLLRAHVEVELHVYPGVPHGFESSGTPKVVKAAYQNRARAVQTV